MALVSLLALAPLTLPAQQQRQVPPPPDSSALPLTEAPANPPASADDAWLPRGMDSLGSHASFHTDFTFDRQMLGLASNFTGDDETQRIVARLRSISVHVYKYPQPGLYNPEMLAYVRSQYYNRGWYHLVTARPKATADNPGATELFVHFVNSNVEGMVLLVSNPTNVDLIVINGTLSPLDLLHLRGHFGIPRFSGDRFVPDHDRNHDKDHDHDRGSYPSRDH
jgi:hypothetical protein